MRTTVTPDGLVEIPEEFRKADARRPGQTCEIERVGDGEHRVRVAAFGKIRGKRKLSGLLGECPVKDFFTARDRHKDTLIAAIAQRHGLTVATRNVDDFTRCGVAVVNPFD